MMFNIVTKVKRVVLTLTARHSHRTMNAHFIEWATSLDVSVRIIHYNESSGESAIICIPVPTIQLMNLRKGYQLKAEDKDMCI